MSGKLENLRFVFVVLILVHMAYVNGLVEFPSAPLAPIRFRNTKDVQKYLNKLHNYYMVLGRPRFGKRSGHSENEVQSYEHESKLMKLVNPRNYDFYDT